MDIEQIRAFCLSLPFATEDIKWKDDLCFSIGNKLFCAGGLHPPHHFSFKVKEEEFDELVSSPDIVSAPYIGRYKWVLVQKSTRLTKKQWKHYIQQSYQLVKSKLSKKVLDQLGKSD